MKKKDERVVNKDKLSQYYSEPHQSLRQMGKCATLSMCFLVFPLNFFFQNVKTVEKILRNCKVGLFNIELLVNSSPGVTSKANVKMLLREDILKNEMSLKIKA